MGKKEIILQPKMTHRHRHAGRSCLFARDDGHDQLGMRDQPWMSDFEKDNVSRGLK